MTKNFRTIAPVVFPESRGLNVNMMPFIMGDKASIPESLSGYLGLIEACPLPEHEMGKVGYITIDERFVEAGTHRRGGLHTEGFGNVRWGGNWGGHAAVASTGSWGGGSWGGGSGLFMANSVARSCMLIDAFVGEGGPGGEITAAQVAGLPETLIEGNTLYWLHDRTPHASLPVSNTNRQFFRLVTSDVSVWYADHSTANPLGVEPRGQKIYGNKFQ